MFVLLGFKTNRHCNGDAVIFQLPYVEEKLSGEPTCVFPKHMGTKIEPLTFRKLAE